LTPPGTLETCFANVCSALVGLVLPPRCGSCRRVGSWLCGACLALVRSPSEPLCVRCGRELEFAGGGCGCRRHLRSLARVRAAAVYDGPLERAIHRYKYEGWRALAPALGGLLAERLASQVPASAFVVWVPLHRARRRSRGYDQVELLAAELRRRLGLRSPRGRLARLRDTPPQVGLDRVRRRENVAGAFAWRGPRLAGEPVVVVDDVMTTGSTLEACAAALRAAGSGPVHGLTLARVIL
jgi:ComF family protein